MRKIQKLALAMLLGAVTWAVYNNTADASYITAYAKTTTFSAPTNPHWGNKKGEEDDDGYYAHWDAVQNAKRYEVYIYYRNDDDGYSKLSSVTTSKTYANLKSKMTKDADYSFKVRAVSSNGKTTGNWSSYAEDVYYDGASLRSSSSSTSSSSSSSGSSSDSCAGTASNELAVGLGASAAATAPVTGGPGAASGTAVNGVIGYNAGFGPTASIGSWQHNDKGWWYATNAAQTTWYNNGWQWIDGNHDGVAECYYFGPDGYAYMNTTTPDGYQVDGSGAWVVGSVVQTKNM